MPVPAIASQLATWHRKRRFSASAITPLIGFTSDGNMACLLRVPTRLAPSAGQGGGNLKLKVEPETDVQNAQKAGMVASGVQ
jgi:hypothetical protein